MCGISAVIDCGSDGGTGLALAAMHRALHRRGPDAEGLLLLPPDAGSARCTLAPTEADWASAMRTGIAFRHLKIQDISQAGAQPLGSADGRHWIVLNGEIYNHRELRVELEAAGHRFRGTSDAEVALAAWRAWGEACLQRFNGMWAMLVLDLAGRRLIGSRDRLGIKPLFYAVDGPRLLLASEPRAIGSAQAGGPRVEPRRFTEFLHGLPPQSADLSFYRDVHPVPAGTVFEVGLDSGPSGPPAFRRYWNLADHALADRSVPFAEARDELHALLRSAVDYQSHAAVNVGSLVSGGIDSSLVAAMLAERRRRQGEAPPMTFSIVYDDPEMSEAPYIWAVTHHAGLASHRHTLSPGETWASIDRVVALQGQPLLGQELIAQQRVYALAREHGATVVLEGGGADELLAGLPSYERMYLRELILGGRVRRLAHELLQRKRRYGLTTAQVARQYVIGPALRPAAAAPRYAWIEDPCPGAEPAPDTSPDPSLLNRHLYRLVRHTNLPVVLLYQDRSSMAHSVESRVPFLDHRVVESCFRLPADYKAGEGERKRILRSIARDYLPPLVLDRTDKKRFVTKAGWMPLRDHADELRAMCAEGTMRTAPHLRGAAVGHFVDGYLTGKHDDGAAVWRLYTAWRWLVMLGPA